MGAVRGFASAIGFCYLLSTASDALDLECFVGSTGTPTNALGVFLSLYFLSLRASSILFGAFRCACYCASCVLQSLHFAFILFEQTPVMANI